MTITETQRAVIQRAVMQMSGGATIEEAIRTAVAELAPTGWAGHDVYLPEGTELRAWYKGRAYWARVVDGAFEYRGDRYSAPSPLAAAITGRPTTNGWEFWEARMPGHAWAQLRTLRKPVG